MLKAISLALNLILAIFQVWRSKSEEAAIRKQVEADHLAKANDQLRKADEIDAAPTPADKRTILDGM